MLRTTSAKEYEKSATSTYLFRCSATAEAAPTFIRCNHARCVRLLMGYSRCQSAAHAGEALHYTTRRCIIQHTVASRAFTLRCARLHCCRRCNTHRVFAAYPQVPLPAGWGRRDLRGQALAQLRLLLPVLAQPEQLRTMPVSTREYP